VSASAQTGDGAFAYWGLVTTFKPENEVVRPGVQLWPEHFTFQNYVHVLLETKIGIWYFLWPFIAVNAEDKMNITVGITQVHDAFGVQYARDLAVAMVAALPVALVYLIFQRRVTQAIMLSAGIKG
jgi:ABC-type glycerol-3-phosphate transport system permease component